MEGIVKCSANYVPLTPISFLERSAIVYRDRVSVVDGIFKFTWSQTLDRCIKLASSLNHLGISRADVVAALAPNTYAMYELHFGVPMVGAVLCALNIRHDSSMVSTLLKHSEAKVIFADYQFLDIARGALDILAKTTTKLPQLIIISSHDKPSSAGNDVSATVGNREYESFLASGNTDFQIVRPTLSYVPGVDTHDIHTMTRCI